MSDPLQALASVPAQAWLVGGALRDRLLGRVSTDFDVALARDSEPGQVARALAQKAGGFAFSLSDAFGAWRVTARDRSWQVDLMGIVGADIEADLRRRDLTVNAIAQPVSAPQGLIDPCGGQADLAAGRLRAVSASAFADDPVRTLRLARLACELNFKAEPETTRLAAASSAELATVASERVFAELRRLLCSERPVDGLKLMDAIGATEAVLPELAALRGIGQSRFHHLDVLDHTRAVVAETVALEHAPEAVFGPAAPALAEFLAAPLANELTRGQALRFGALLHDIAKPQTRAETSEGRVTFMHHDETGAAVVASILTRLRASERLIGHVAALTRHHLRLGFLVHHTPLDRRHIYRYLDACAPVGVDVTVLSVADRLATRGENAQGAIDRHLELAGQILPAALEWTDAPPRPPIRGDELCTALGIGPGPQLGELLHELEEAAYAGEVRSREEAIGYARELVGPDR
ncbi:MAG: HDIG domain-containing protein [Actinomycetota bacterium]|nr:HDIG domain-containing protein [Actinomycetota bacterium]